jgi:phage terminase large subunit GpA-like protein
MKIAQAFYQYVWVCPHCGEKQVRDLDYRFGNDSCCDTHIYRVKPPREDVSGSALRTTRKARRKAK